MATLYGVKNERKNVWQIAPSLKEKYSECINSPSAGAAPAHQAWGYAYDAIGNRLATVRGSGASQQPALTTSYQASAVNQYSAVTTPRGLEFSGAAPAEATVSVAVDGGTAETVDRSVAEGQVAELDSFRTVIPLATDQAEGRWVNVAVTSSVGTGAETVETTQDGWLFAPPAMYPPVHDLDGNLVEDARWTYEWDAENRLIAARNLHS